MGAQFGINRKIVGDDRNNGSRQGSRAEACFAVSTRSAAA
jgi:hypothetical protein